MKANRREEFDFWPGYYAPKVAKMNLMFHRCPDCGSMPVVDDQDLPDLLIRLESVTYIPCCPGCGHSWTLAPDETNRMIEQVSRMVRESKAE